jgi:hypothetical protein
VGRFARQAQRQRRPIVTSGDALARELENEAGRLPQSNVHGAVLLGVPPPAPAKDQVILPNGKGHVQGARDDGAIKWSGTVRGWPLTVRGPYVKSVRVVGDEAYVNDRRVTDADLRRGFVRPGPRLPAR